jgi:hypothetical protein
MGVFPERQMLKEEREPRVFSPVASLIVVVVLIAMLGALVFLVDAIDCPRCKGKGEILEGVLAGVPCYRSCPLCHGRRGVNLWTRVIAELGIRN